MGVIELRTEIAAPIQRAFDAARDIDVHTAAMTPYREAAVAGRTSGQIGAGEDVTFRARHFGLTWDLTSRVVEFDPPTAFRDSLVRGPFRRLDHEHRFVELGDSRTLMVDRFDYRPPLGFLGWIADRLIVGRRLRTIVRIRAQAIKDAAETGR